jgi:hypothetical protein
MSAPVLILLCLGPCHGDFYLPLELNEPQVCPNHSEHPVAVYAPILVRSCSR